MKRIACNASSTKLQTSSKNGKMRSPCLNEIFTILEGLANHLMTYDDQIVRQILECVVVESKDQIKVVFVGGTEVIQTLC